MKKKKRIDIGIKAYILTHKGFRSVLHDGPALLGLQQDKHDPGVVLIMETRRNVFLLIHHHVGVRIRQLAVDLIQLPCKTAKT